MGKRLEEHCVTETLIPMITEIVTHGHEIGGVCREDCSDPHAQLQTSGRALLK